MANGQKAPAMDDTYDAQQMRPAAAGWWRRSTDNAKRNRPGMTPPRDYAGATDAMLVLWSADGDRRAFDTVVLRHGAFLLRVATRLLRDPAAAEDVVQEALVRAWAQARKFDPQRARLTTWLYRIVVNLCIDQQRRNRPEPLPEAYDPVDPAAGAPELLEATEQQGALVRALADLPLRQRAAMTLVYDEGLSGAEAARVLGLTAKAVERLLARGRAFLRDRLRQETCGEEGKQ